jgi:hypothetical protein
VRIRQQGHSDRWPAEGEAVADRSEPNNEFPPDPVPFQFGLGRLFVLTAICAGVLAAVDTISAPVPFRLSVAIYFMLLATYALLRIPHIYQIWRHTGRRCRELETRMTEARSTTEVAEKALANAETEAPATPDRPNG